ncbi:endonuclease/exonuclease/phosphatase family protein [Acuticoccus sp. MNP-M23]|uniref:endonuclease/exonuclease/phosphatase family protein n=1 Tax=Acuticoccus sp. MNP-M23 TaxID=3072793 RepID=UPI002815224F|nr:endonuclease/exonuclease/phosphatase family protein [Acuticoccus sp. MNP-M23]WMS43076.1 endonuclease/exonuclease/phosphatase family protein [Acuticoccus sp. MNP-M23]
MGLVRTWALLVAIVMPAAASAQAPEKPAGAIRFATYNVSLYGKAAGEVVARLEGGADPAAMASAEIIRKHAPDVLLIQELDRDDAGRALSLYVDGYLGGAQYPHRVLFPSNTGIASGVDLNSDGVVGTEGRDYGEDALGYGLYPGQYAFALVSRLPLGPVRTFSNLLWRDMPGNRIPPELSSEGQAVLPLSSKTHALVPVEIGGTTVWVAAAHPTPPLPGNRLLPPRNADEIRLLADLLDPAASTYAVDDAGTAGGLPAGSLAVVMGDLNADPAGGNSVEGAIAQLLDNPLVTDPVPASAAHGANTAKFRRGAMRVDYVLPSAALRVVGAGVYWPEGDETLDRASDHRLVYVDVMLP